jgi:hypothetical protein
MTDTNTAAPKKQAVAVRDWIDSNGAPVATGDESKAVGFRYISLPMARKANAAYNPESDAATAGTFYDHVFPAIGEPVTADLLMCGIFGGLTLAGNVVNTATNGPKGDPNADVISLVAARFAEIAGGTWADRAAGTGGIRYDREKLAAAIAAAKGEKDPAPYLARMDEKVDPKTGATVANDTKGAISYGARCLRNAKVKDAYDRLTGGGTSLDSI